MRIQLQIQHPSNVILPLDYPHKVQAWLYQVLWNADSSFARWLHDQGYRSDEQGKRFKLFTFGRWECRPYQWQSNGMRLRGTQSTLICSFFLPKDGKHFIHGIFRGQHGYMNNAEAPWDFSIQSISIFDDMQWKEQMHYRSQTPIIIAQAKTDADKYEQYVFIDEPELASANLELYKTLFIQNLVAKTQAALPDWQLGNQEVALKILGKVKRDGIRTKNVKMIGQQLEFQLTAPIEMHQVGYYAGFGKNSSTGCGFCEVKNLEG